jgi:hypothetical protein
LAAHEALVQLVADGFLVRVSQVANDTRADLDGDFRTEFRWHRWAQQPLPMCIQQLQVAVISTAVPVIIPVAGQPVESFKQTGIVQQELPAATLLVEQTQMICQPFYLGLLAFIQIGFQAAQKGQVIETAGRQGEHQEGGKENDKEFVADAHGKTSSIRAYSVAWASAFASGLHNVFTMAVATCSSAFRRPKRLRRFLAQIDHPGHHE